MFEVRDNEIKELIVGFDDSVDGADKISLMVSRVGANGDRRWAGILAIALDGETPAEERKEALRRFSDGEIKVIVNCSLFCQGLDIPVIDAVQIARPTKSLGLWLQMVGRVLRPAPGKTLALIIDHTNNWRLHASPTRKRIWTLDGVEHPDEVKKPKRKPKEPVEVEPLAVVETAVQLTAIAEPTVEEQWLRWLQDLIAHVKSRGYQDGWIYHKLMEVKPPLDISKTYKSVIESL